jgi:hypothetical protein
LAQKVVFQAGARDLLAVVQVFRPHETDHGIDQQRLEGARHGVGARLAGLLVEAMDGVARECAALAGFEIHQVLAQRAAFQREGRVARFAQQRQVDAEAGVRGLGPGNRLEHEVDRRAPLDGGEGVRDVGQHAGLGRDRMAADDVVEHGDELDHLRHVVGGRVDADDGIAAAVHQAVEQARRDAGNVVKRVVRLQAGRQGAGQADGVAEARDDPALAGHQHQVLDAHDFRDGGGHLGRDARRDPGPGIASSAASPSSQSRDAILVGGHNGLVCAFYLARAGLKVTVLEQRAVVGGAAVTEEFHPGFRNSVASYTVSLLNPKVIRDMDLAAHGLRVVERPLSNFLPLDDGAT